MLLENVPSHKKMSQLVSSQGVTHFELEAVDHFFSGKPSLGNTYMNANFFWTAWYLIRAIQRFISNVFFSNGRNSGQEKLWIKNSCIRCVALYMLVILWNCLWNNPNNQHNFLFFCCFAQLVCMVTSTFVQWTHTMNWTCDY